MAKRQGALVGSRARGVLGATLITLLLVTGLSFTDGATSARADVAAGLPTWADVEAAKANEAAAAAKAVELEALIADLKVQVAITQQASADAAARAMAAEEQRRLVEERLTTLQEQAAASEAEAEAAADQAAALVAQLYRSGGVDRNVELFLEGDADTADALLDRLAQVEKATERNTTVSERAEQAKNTAVSLGEQTKTAMAERERLKKEADEIAAEAAAIAAQIADQAQQQEAAMVTLEAQLAALKDTTVNTTAGYEQRLVLEAAERERLRKEAEERARREAEERERQRLAEEERRRQEGGTPPPVVAPPSGGPSTPTGGYWVNPLGWGYRVTTEWWGYSGHLGIDLAIGAGTPIYAAAGGTVAYAGYFGGYGNVVYIDHGNGVQTRYAHQDRWPPVWAGKRVNAGEIIGYVGNTGYSFGNHLHYETLVGGVQTNPRAFMAAQGVYF